MLTGAQAGFVTDDNFGNARILDVRPVRVLEQLQLGRVVVVTGFQGQTENGDFTTLGRGEAIRLLQLSVQHYVLKWWISTQM